MPSMRKAMRAALMSGVLATKWIKRGSLAIFFCNSGLSKSNQRCGWRVAAGEVRVGARAGARLQRQKAAAGPAGPTTRTVTAHFPARTLRGKGRSLQHTRAALPTPVPPLQAAHGNALTGDGM